jgi:hypothetical protein
MLKNRSVPADIILPHITYQNVATVMANRAGACRARRIVEDLNETAYRERQNGTEDLKGHHLLFFAARSGRKTR